MPNAHVWTAADGTHVIDVDADRLPAPLLIRVIRLGQRQDRLVLVVDPDLVAIRTNVQGDAYDVVRDEVAVVLVPRIAPDLRDDLRDPREFA